MSAVPAFLQWSSHQLLSFLQSPGIQAMMFGQYGPIEDSRFVKHLIYQDFWALAERRKYDGFEKLNKLMVDFEQKNKKFRQSVSHEYTVPIYQLIKKLKN